MTSTAEAIAPEQHRSLALRLRHTDPSTYIVYVGFVLIFAVMALTLHGDGFLDKQNLLNILLQTAPSP